VKDEGVEKTPIGPTNACPTMRSLLGGRHQPTSLAERREVTALRKDSKQGQKGGLKGEKRVNKGEEGG